MDSFVERKRYSEDAKRKAKRGAKSMGTWDVIQLVAKILLIIAEKGGSSKK